MKIYFYCSYTGSPVGFIMGSMSQLPQGQWSDLSKDGISNEIRACFEHGIVKNAVGRISSLTSNSYARKWVLVIKNITCPDIHSDRPLTWYINIALETDSQSQFETWIKRGVNIELCEKLSCILTVDKNNDFGYTIDRHELSNIIDASLASTTLPNKVASVALDDYAIEFTPNLPYKNKQQFVKKYLPFLLPYKMKEMDSWTIFEKKTLKISKGSQLVMGAILLVLVGSTILMTVRGEKKKAPVGVSSADYQLPQPKPDSTSAAVSPEVKKSQVIRVLVSLPEQDDLITGYLSIIGEGDLKFIQQNDNLYNNKLIWERSGSRLLRAEGSDGYHIYAVGKLDPNPHTNLYLMIPDSLLEEVKYEPNTERIELRLFPAGDHANH